MPIPDYGNWHPSGQNIKFAETTACRYLEILKYPDQSEPLQSEGDLDDASLPGWYEKVGGSQSRIANDKS